MKSNITSAVKYNGSGIRVGGVWVTEDGEEEECKGKSSTPLNR